MAADDKTEKASPKKRRDERKKGNIFQSKDIVSALSILGVFFTLKLTLPFVYQYLSGYFVQVIASIKSSSTFGTSEAMRLFSQALIAFAVSVGAVMLVAMIIGIVASGAQTRFLFAYENMKFKFSRLSPLQGIKRLFSLRSVIELLKSLLKIVIIIAVLMNSFQGILRDAMNLINMDIFQAVVVILNNIMNVVITLSIVFIGLSALDYIYQWWEYERNIKMSKQEMKEEYKHMEGDPQIKGKIKEAQRKISMQRMMQQVPSADVVVRNPTHYAIALRYNVDHDRAPIVVAKGADHIALRIIATAEENGVPITENRPLARALYEAVELNREIPAEYYGVLAEIMAWVYSLKQEGDKA